MGELEVRGVWIASGYYDDESQADRWTDDGWFKTGDIVTIDERGFIEIQDRSKDVIKSGGEWISSVLMENALMGHPAVAEAAVIAVPDPKWQERPLAVVVWREGQSATPEELREHLAAAGFAKWQLPDRLRERRRDPEDGRRQVPQDGAARPVREGARRGLRLEGKTFLVTGGRSGLGAAVVAMLEDAGASAVVADLPECDVTDEASVEELVAQSHNLHGVVCCAGIGGSARILDFEAEQFRRIVDVNLVGTFLSVKHAARRLAENEPDEAGTRGVVVMTASNAAFDGQIGQHAYTASKAGVAGMTLPLARDLARHGIRVVTIAPGPHDTPMLARLRDDIRASLESQVPFPKRLGRAEDFAGLVRHVIENEYLNGETIRLDGALRMGPR